MRCMDERREKERSWPAIVASVAAWQVAALVAAAAAGVSAVAVAGLSNALVDWRAGRVVGRRYEEILIVADSREGAARGRAVRAVLRREEGVEPGKPGQQ